MNIKTISIAMLCCCMMQHIGFAQSWNLVWADSFTNNSINTNNWTFNVGTGNSGWGNNELQYYTNRPENVTVKNGNLLIIAKQESYQGSDYTSARIITKNLQQFTYGKIEARIKLPQTKGVWPAFWMLGANIDAVSWPKCGEIDVLEHVNTESKIFGTIHWDNNGYVQSGGSTNCNVSNYHIYAVEWSADSIKWLLDNDVYYRYNIKNNVNNTGAFHKPFFVLLNMAVGGNWPGSPNTSSVFPDTMMVDYVQVFQRFALDVKEENNLQTVKIYPNPVHDLIIIETENKLLENLQVCIYNAMGVMVKNILLDKNKITHTIDVSNLEAGNYYFTMSGNDSIKGRFLKE